MSKFQYCYNLIYAITKSCREEGLTKKSLERIIFHAYPYDERNGYNYSAWLKAKKMVYIQLDIIVRKQVFSREDSLF